jgi:hypothetical protein
MFFSIHMRVRVLSHISYHPPPPTVHAVEKNASFYPACFYILPCSCSKFNQNLAGGGARKRNSRKLTLNRWSVGVLYFILYY